ncbi:restriction endonuclease subunit S [Deinococcus multiflagellatus]|uniref:Restriction endonuclease subunit S n=1 Tax=Deinococcus multiflagellatus TaxID=1656887 RepID=A0ABW1ZRT4_9DEIO
MSNDSLSPLPEQIRIADKLDTLLARVEAGRERLERVPKLVKQFRQAVLSAAVSGELTREWRGGADHKWVTGPIGSFGAAILGRQRSPKYHEGANMRPYLRVQNVFEDFIDINDVMEMVFDDKDFRTYKLEHGDILLNEGQSPHLLGRPAMFRNEVKDACFTNTLIRFRSGPNITPQFALYTFRHYMHSGVFRGEGAITTNIAHLGLGRFTSLQMSVPPLDEQAEIVHRVEALFAIADRLEARYQAALTSFDRLTPALLAKAFRGELVPQDPSDEPASVLLERIQTQRAQEGTGVKKGRKPKATAPTEGDSPKRRGRPPKAEAEGVDASEPKRRGRPPKARADGASVPQASSMEDAIRLLQERGQQRAEGTRQVSLFSEEVTS